MSCGDAGHILLSDNVADSLRHLSKWQHKIQPVGECRVKDGWVRVWNLVDGPVGNPAMPKKSKRSLRRRHLLIALAGVAALLLMAAAVAGAFWMGRSRMRTASKQTEASIAVLPFVDLSPEKDQAYLSEGLTEELINGLAKTRGLRVAGRQSSFQFKNKSDGSRAIGRKLNVANLLEGSVRKQGNRARVAVRLINAEDGFELWSETFDRELNDIFAIQKEIAIAVAGELKVELLGKSQPFPKSTNAAAYSAYLQGRFFFARNSSENMTKAANYFEQATTLDPNYAPAWVGLADARRFLTAESYVPAEKGYLAARNAAERALNLDPSLADAHAAMGSIKMLRVWDWAGADVEFHRALELEPGNARVVRDFAALAKVMGRLDESLAFYGEAIRLDPLSSAARRNLGIALYFAGRQQEAMAAFQQGLELAPEVEMVHGWMARAYLAQSRPEEALIEAEREKNPIFRLAGLALVNHALGRKKESRENLAELISKVQAVAPYQIAEIYAFRGDKDKAFEWLQRAYTERDDGIRDIKGDPLLKNLANDPRYSSLLKQMRLPLSL
jgi:TolB-like protein/thioredoxin-like negative regulator of GroEL